MRTHKIIICIMPLSQFNFPRKYTQYTFYLAISFFFFFSSPCYQLFALYTDSFNYIPYEDTINVITRSTTPATHLYRTGMIVVYEPRNIFYSIHPFRFERNKKERENRNRAGTYRVNDKQICYDL